jgi:putative lipoic acid-binding regulatory protein
MDKQPDYEALRKQLNELQWPSLYMFKFIVPSDNKKIAQVESLFGDDAEVKHQPSSNGKYTSITAREVMLSVDDVLMVYQQASAIEGIIAL